MAAALFLRSEEGLCPDIQLQSGCQVIIGRGPLTGLKDKRVGRRQLILTVDGEKIQVRQEGANSSIVAGQVLQRGKCHLLKVGQCLNLLEGRHRFLLMREERTGHSPAHTGLPKIQSEKLRIDNCFLETSKVPLTTRSDSRDWRSDMFSARQQQQLQLRPGGGQLGARPGRIKQPTKPPDGDEDEEGQKVKEKSKMPATENDPLPPHPQVRPNWSTGLRTDMKKAERVVFSTPEVVVIKDKFPKAKHHFLVLPREELDNLQSLELKHLSLLEQMQAVGNQVAARHTDSQFRMGFHAKPSMLHLHLHLISQEFESVGLKTKRHWNSFTTDFFLPVENVIAELKELGKVKKKDDLAANIDLPLACHKCDLKPKNMPELKKHIATHF